jgi:uncharacterized protein
MTIAAFLIMLLVSVCGVVLTLLTLPGVWVILIVALFVQLLWGDPQVFSWWTLGAALLVALLGEAIELASSALGATRAGGGASGAIGSIVGSLVGAILGSIFIPVPIVGTVVGGVLGAGAGAIAAERGISRRPWGQSYRIGQGAAIGRLISTIVKVGVAAAVGVMLTLAVLL